MALRLTQHPQGPLLPKEAKTRRFKSYVDLANWADEHLPYGVYFVRNHTATTLAGIRKITHDGLFHVEGRGNV